MKLFINHFDKSEFEPLMEHLKDVDFSLFLDSPPKSQDELSNINIMVLQEPNEYFGYHKWVVENQEIFNVILSWSDLVLNNCKQAIYLPFGGTWFKPDQYEKKHNKEFKVAHLRGKLLKTYGQSIRHEIYDRENEIIITPTKFFDVYGSRDIIEEARIGKEEVFGDCQYGVVIENTSHRGYFTEKILDCFLLKTIPIYWGCSNIGDFFNEDGIIKFGNTDEFVYITNSLKDGDYGWKTNAIEENYQLALKYVNYPQNIVNKITEIFKLNQII